MRVEILGFIELKAKQDVENFGIYIRETIIKEIKKIESEKINLK